MEEVSDLLKKVSIAGFGVQREVQAGGHCGSVL